MFILFLETTSPSRKNREKIPIGMVPSSLAGGELANTHNSIIVIILRFSQLLSSLPRRSTQQSWGRWWGALSCKSRLMIGTGEEYPAELGEVVVW